MPCVVGLASKASNLESDAPRIDSQRSPISVLENRTCLTLTVTLTLIRIVEAGILQAGGNDIHLTPI